MKEFIAMALSNFTVTFLAIGILVSLVTLWRGRDKRGTRSAADVFLGNFILFALGISFFYNFIMHVFFAEVAAQFIGWEDSPFQYEVGYASLGYSVVAILAHRSTFHFRLASILGPALFFWGAAVGHIREIITVQNMAPGNAGAMLWTDILFPVIGFALLFWRYPQGAQTEQV